MSLSASVAWWARSEPQRTALIYENCHIGYGELQGRVEAISGLLAARGVKPGEVVALLMKNSAAFIELAVAVNHAGAVLLPINYRLGNEEVRYIVEHAGAHLLFVDVELKDAVLGLDQMLSVIEVDQLAQADGSRLAVGSTPRREAHLTAPESLFRLMYTSGTTDRPKGVMHSEANFTWKCFDHICALGLSQHERLLVVGPLYHVGAFDLPGLAVLLVGGLLAVLRDFEPEQVLNLIERERLTGGWLAPVMLSRLLSLGNVAEIDLSSLRWVIGGGERTPEERIHEFCELFTQARYIDAYGLTESCSGDTLMQAGQEVAKIGSTGRALAHLQIDVRDESGSSLPAGEVGEICLKGPKVTKGYWRDEQKTVASFYGDWFRTGDVGYLDADGYLYLTDRKKDMIISGGENIASSEVERVLYKLPQISEAAVIGLPDERWGERVTAVVVLHQGAQLSLQELTQHCRAFLGGFKIPRQLEICDALPRNPSGKVVKRILREQFAL